MTGAVRREGSTNHPVFDGLPRGLFTRFAPSPTGYLHLGHVVNAIYVWGISRAIGGRVALRIEDHDRTRCRPEFEAALLEDLDWLGFEADVGRSPIVRQSDRDARYSTALARLQAVTRVYACRCSRREIGGERYDGQCRERGLPLDAGLGIRVQLPPGIEHLEDRLLGPIAEDPCVEYGDLLVRDRHGCWTYQFAVTVDDMDDGISLVIRGADLASSTSRQLALARLLGRVAAPAFIHHPLVFKADGAKVSKAAGDTGIRELRARGFSAAGVIGLAATAVGLAPAGTKIEAAAVSAFFE